MALPGPQRTMRPTGHSALLRAVVVEREPQLVDEAGDALLQAGARVGDASRGRPRSPPAGRLEADVGEPLGGVLGLRPVSAARRSAIALQADLGDAGEEAGAPAGDGEVGDVAEVAVEDRLSRAGRSTGGSARPFLARSGACRRTPASARIIPKAERSTPTGSQPGAAHRLEEGADHVPAGGDDDDVELRRRALLGRHAADDLVLEHRLVERHRHLLLGLKANRCLHLLRVLDRRQAQGAHDHALVADPEPDPLGELVLGEERLQRARRSHRGRAPRPRGRRPAPAARSPRRSPRRRAVLLDLGRGDAAGLDVEADDRRRLLLLVSCIAGGCEPCARLSNRQKGRRPFALQLLIYRKTWTVST